MSTPQAPEPSPRPSSVARRAAPAATPADPPTSDIRHPTSAIADALPAADPTDGTPTVISLNRPRLTDAGAADGLKGKKLGHFELIEPIGVGGMAKVIRARDLQLDRIVALKVLPPEMAVDPENITRFKSEARAAAKLDHENIARVFFCGEDQGLHFIAFEYVEGVDLRTLLDRDGILSPLQAVHFMLQIATGLAHAEERGVVHRDIKPSNVLITPEGRAKIVDMGLARHVDPVHGGLTQSGVTLGTFDYISPEQAIEPRAADIRSDIYSLGCTFYHLLTGQPPVPEGTAAKKLHHHQHVQPLDPRDLNPAIPDELAAVLARMMAKQPRDRYQKPEQLIQHLIHVARKLNPSESYGGPTVLFMDAPLPSPPRFSPLLVGLAGIAAVVVLAVVFGLGDNRDPRVKRVAGWASATDGIDGTAANGASTPTATTPAAPAPASEPKYARTIDELARLFEQQAEYIVLTGEEYDLSDLRASDGAAGLFVAGRKLKLVGQAKGKADGRPVLRMKSSSERMAVPGAVLAALNLAGTGSDAIAELQHLRFEIDGSDHTGPPLYAVLARGLRRLKAVDCEFVHQGLPDATRGGSVRVDARAGAEATETTLERCFFVRGAVAVEMTNRGLLKAVQCAFGPHSAVFLVHADAVWPADRPFAELTHCTAMLSAGTIFQLEKNVSGTIRAQHCLFARVAEANDGGDVVLIRQSQPKGAVRFAGLENASHGRNAYYNVVLWEDATTRAATVAECRRQQLPFHDAGALELAKAPWRNGKPLALLDDNPAEAFALQTGPAQLRTGPRRDGALGVQRCAWGEIYATPLPSPQDDAAEMVAGPITVDPSQATDETQRRYKTLAAAVQAAKSGDTIALAFNGVQDFAPLELDGSDERLTIQAADGFRPVLRLNTDTARANAALFTLYNGSLTFKDLQFRLKPGRADKAKRAVVAVAGAGHCTFQNCVATLEEADGSQLSLVALTVDPETAPVEGAPKIRVKQCFVRGKGDLLAVRGSRPFDLDLDNTLAVLDGSLVTLLGQPKEPPLSPQSQVTCRRVTAYLNDALLELRAADAERKTAGLVPTQVNCTECLFVAAGEWPLVVAIGVDGDTVTKQLLAWEGRGNLYGNYQKLLHVELPNEMKAMMPTMPADLSPKTWLTFTRESEDSFGKVSVLRIDRPFARSQPGDFRVKLSDMKRPEATAGDYGANLNQLPLGDDE